MTVAVANVANTNTFLFWQSITNQLATLMSNAVITTTANGSTAQTAGNASISGTLFANIFTSNTSLVNTSMYVGNSTVNVAINSTAVALANSTSNLTLTVPTSTQVSNGQYFLNANGQYALIVLSAITTNSVTTTGTSTQNIDSWAVASFRSAEYQVNVNDNNANNHYASKLLVTHDTASGYITEYGQITTNSAMGTFSVTVAAGNVVLQFTPVSTSTQVKYARTVI